MDAGVKIVTDDEINYLLKRRIGKKSIYKKKILKKFGLNSILHAIYWIFFPASPALSAPFTFFNFSYKKEQFKAGFLIIFSPPSGLKRQNFLKLI